MSNPGPTVLVMNVNTTASMTESMVASARSVAAPGTVVIGSEPAWGPDSCEGYYDSFVSAAAILDRLAELTSAEREGGPLHFDGMVWSGFGEHGREAAMEFLNVPVVTITDAAAAVASLIGHRFGVVTSLGRTIPMIEDCYRLSGAIERCAAVLATELGVLELEVDHDRLVERFVASGRECMARGADVLILGCGGMSGMAEAMSAALGVPVVDGVASATKLIESLYGLGLSTSKANAFATPLPKQWTGWPVRR